MMCVVRGVTTSAISRFTFPVRGEGFLFVWLGVLIDFSLFLWYALHR